VITSVCPAGYTAETAVQEDTAQVRLGFLIEQTLGHVTHYVNLRSAIDADSSVDAVWYPLGFEATGPFETLPLLRSNWSIRSSWRARRVLLRDSALQRYDALFFHTQVTTLLSGRIMRHIPSVVSLDATPMNYDSLGAGYGHRRAGAFVEGVKRVVNMQSLHAAKALVTWCDWAKQSLIHDYGIDSHRVTVIPPGVDMNVWSRPADRTEENPIRILFVGADFVRKGGDMLLQAFDGLRENCELHIVTKAPLSAGHGVFVYRDASPNGDILRRLYATSDIFVLPTLADCFPVAVQEAMAAGLPVVATDVGAMREAVMDQETGLLVPPGDVSSLYAALQYLAVNAAKRRAMGIQGRSLAERQFDSAVNARRLVEIMTSVARK
jgi:glycosyltransferase involved in cell wall biosynthesis